jgi:RNA polymerase sigma-70 factor (ECF subfamily)
MRDLQRFRGASTFRTWLFGIAVNRTREIFRSTNDTEEEVDVPAAITSPDVRIDIERAVERLPFRYREVFVLHDVYEHTHAEIASLLGIDEGTSKSNLSRARARLRELMGDD